MELDTQVVYMCVCMCVCLCVCVCACLCMCVFMGGARSVGEPGLGQEVGRFGETTVLSHRTFHND